MLIKMFLAFLTSLFTGVTLRTPPPAWLAVGLTGMLGWGTSAAMLKQGIPELVAAVSGAMVVGLLSEILARLQKQPVTVYIVSGIIPLVPGIIAYNTMLQFLEKNFNLGLLLAFKAFLIASYLAAGVAVAPLLVRHFREVVSRWRLFTKH
ncbi:MAG: threonine/serine exporter family protein [Firmicutes bacterium]|nr:threonine/serine exporter family protein [Bacillota bacterium]